MSKAKVVRIENGGPYFPEYDFSQVLHDDLVRCLTDIAKAPLDYQEKEDTT